MPSLSSYDVGKKSFEGRRYKADIEAAKEGMRALLAPLEELNGRQRANGKRLYKPTKIFLLGNHEHRINRAVENDAKLEGVLSISDLEYEKDWEVHPFLDVVVVNGVAFSHYFTSGLLGRPVSTAQACLSRKHMSCVQGHQQGKQIATGYRADGVPVTCIIAGSCYEHDEDYLGPQGNKHWRGVVMLHEVNDGAFDEMFCSLRFIKERYGSE